VRKSNNLGNLKPLSNPQGCPSERVIEINSGVCQNPQEGGAIY